MSNGQVNIDTLRQFTPLDGLKRENIAALAKKTELRRLAPGEVLFKAGDAQKRTYYLLSGRLELSDEAGSTEIIAAGSDAARKPLAPMLPRRCTAKAVEAAEYISIDTDQNQQRHARHHADLGSDR